MSLLPFGRKRDEVAVLKVFSDFQSEVAEIEGASEPILRRVTLVTVTLALVVVAIWATYAQIDRVVTARGKLAPVEQAVVIQPLDTSIIRSLNAKVGDVVKAGQVLATLDSTFTQADVGQYTGQITTLEANIARLEAEYAGRPFTVPATAGIELKTQASVWRQRQAGLKAQLQSFDERIKKTLAGMGSRKREKDFLSRRLVDLQQIEGMRQELAENKVGSKLQALSANADRLEVERNLSMLTNQEAEAQNELDDIKAQREATLQKWNSDVGQELVTQRSQRDGLVEQLNKARKHEELVNLTAPIDAVVLEIGPYSVNSVIAGAAILYRLVPANSPLEVQAMIDGSEIGFVKEGDPVEIKFDAYVYMEHGTAEGVVTSISEDSFSQRSDIASSPLTGTGASAPSTPDIRTGLFYKVKIAITAVKLRNVPAKFALLPGLPLSAEIKIGGRTVMSYLLRPLLGGLGESMREP